MKGKSFETFQVTPGNQEAYTVCRRIAMLEEMGPALVILLGPEGCGKSHLLWAVAKQVRAGTLPAGLALITAGNIPEKVRALVEDCRPLQGRRAMLLVDGLERFDAESRRLDALIETFQACQHPVVVTTSVHPNRLSRLTVPLVNRLAGGRVVTMEARVQDADEAVAERIQALEEVARELQRQRDALQEQLDQSREAVAAARQAAEAAESNAAQLRQDSETTASQLTSLQFSLDSARANKASAESRAATLEGELERVRGELAAAVTRIRAAESEAEYAMAQQARLQGALSASKLEAEECPVLRASLRSAEACIAEAVEALYTMQQEQDARSRDLASEAQSLADGLAESANARATTAGRESQLRAALEEAGSDRKHLRDSLSATRERLKAVEYEWATSRKVLAIQTAEMDALRHAAASQAAQASIHAGELEQRISSLETALDSLRATQPPPGETDGAAARSWSMALENMQAQLAALREAREGAVPEPAGEQALFEADFFEVLPEDFDVDVSRSLPGVDAAFEETIHGALGGPDEDARAEREESSIDRAK